MEVLTIQILLLIITGIAVMYVIFGILRGRNKEVITVQDSDGAVSSFIFPGDHWKFGFDGKEYSEIKREMVYGQSIKIIATGSSSYIASNYPQFKENIIYTADGSGAIYHSSPSNVSAKGFYNSQKEAITAIRAAMANLDATLTNAELNEKNLEKSRG